MLAFRPTFALAAMARYESNSSTVHDVVAKSRRTQTDHAKKRIRKGIGRGIADLFCNLVDWQMSVRKETRGASHSQESHMLHRRPTKRLDR